MTRRNSLRAGLSLLLLCSGAQATQKTIATGDDELDDLEVQRLTVKRGLSKSLLTQQSGKLQVSLAANESLNRYTSEDWAKGQLVGALELIDPEDETGLGTGTFFLIARERKGSVRFYCFSERSQKIVAKLAGREHKGKSLSKEPVSLTLLSPDGSEMKNTCSPLRVRTIVKICCWIGRKRYCIELSSAKG
jgi:hypothetical protein